MEAGIVLVQKTMAQGVVRIAEIEAIAVIEADDRPEAGTRGLRTDRELNACRTIEREFVPVDISLTRETVADGSDHLAARGSTQIAEALRHVERVIGLCLEQDRRTRQRG